MDFTISPGHVMLLERGLLCLVTHIVIVIVLLWIGRAKHQEPRFLPTKSACINEISKITMDFSRIPDCVVVQIIHQLPLREQFRIASVNLRFKQMSKMAIELSTELIFPEPFFQCKDVKPLMNLVKSCAPNLRKWVINDTIDAEYNLVTEKLFNIFSAAPRPQLIELKFTTVASSLKIEVFRDLLVNCPNLRRLDLVANFDYSGIPNPLPPVACTKLEKVTISSCCDSNIAGWLVRNCSNLTHVTISRFSIVSSAPFVPWNWNAVLNRIFAKNHGIRAFKWHSMDEQWQLDAENLWRLKSLRLLKLDGCIFSEQFLKTIASSFPGLQNLILCSNADQVTNEGLTALSTLVSLRHFMFQRKLFAKSDLSKAWCVLGSKWPKLETVCFIDEVSRPVVMSFLAFCPRLHEIRMNNLKDIDSTAAAKRFLSSLKGMQIRQCISIELINGDGSIWFDDAVQQVLNEVNDGCTGSIRFCLPTYQIKQRLQRQFQAQETARGNCSESRESSVEVEDQVQANAESESESSVEVEDQVQVNPEADSESSEIAIEEKKRPSSFKQMIMNMLYSLYRFFKLT